MNELDKLREMLKEAEIPYEDYQELRLEEEDLIYWLKHSGENGKYKRNQIIYGRYSKSDWLFDAVCQGGSYGSKESLVESYGDLGVDTEGNPMVLTAEQAFEIIKKDWDSKH